MKSRRAGSLTRDISADVEFGPQAAIDVVAESISWFDRFLAKKPEETAKPFPAVRYFVMGENTWRTSTSWPPAEATITLRGS